VGKKVLQKITLTTLSIPSKFSKKIVRGLPIDARRLVGVPEDWQKTGSGSWRIFIDYGSKVS
jgi:hypothetical protein